MSSTIEIDESLLAVELEKAALDVVRALKTRLGRKGINRPVAVNANVAAITVRATGLVNKSIFAPSLAPITDAEFASIRSLMVWVAHNQNVREETVQEVVKDELGVADVTKIHRNDYQRTVDFLLRLQTDLAAHSEPALSH